MSVDNDMQTVWNAINKQKVDNPRDAFNRLKAFMYYYPEDERTIKIKAWILSMIKQEFLNPKLINALNIPDEKKYLKQVNVFKNLPCMLHNNEFMDIYYSLVNGPSEYFGNHPNFYKGCKWFCREMNDYEIPDEIFDKLDEYCTNNKPIFRTGFNHYDDYNIELNRLREIVNNGDSIDFRKNKESISEDLRRNGKDTDDYSVLSYYKNMKTGIVGEYDTFRKVTNLNNGIFVAKEFGNGFGYDIFYLYDDEEYLIEAKATLNNDGNDCFYMTDNEKDVLEDSLTRDNTNFLIVRVYIDLEKDYNYAFKVLKYIPETNSFISTNNEDGNIVEYTEDKYNPLQFNRKQKTLEYKNGN